MRTFRNPFTCVQCFVCPEKEDLYLFVLCLHRHESLVVSDLSSAGFCVSLFMKGFHEIL